MKLISMLVLLSCVFLRANDVSGKDKKAPDSENLSFHSKGIVEELALTSVQVAKLKELDEAYAKERQKWMNEHGAVYEELESQSKVALKAGDNPKWFKIERQRARLTNELLTMRQKYFAEFSKYLDENQKHKSLFGGKAI